MGKKYKRMNQIKSEKPDIRKMIKYTAKKILWVTNYSLSFSRKDEAKEILIKLLGCLVILQFVSLVLSFILKGAKIVSFNPFFSFGFLILFGMLIFKKEVISFFKMDKSENKRTKTIF